MARALLDSCLRIASFPNRGFLSSRRFLGELEADFLPIPISSTHLFHISYRLSRTGEMHTCIIEGAPGVDNPSFEAIGNWHTFDENLGGQS